MAADTSDPAGTLVLPAPPPAPRTSRAARIAAWVLLVPVLAVAAATVDPAALGLSTTPGFLHLVPFRLAAGIGALAVGLVFAAALLLPRPTRPWIRATAAAVMVAVGLAHGGIAVSRGWSGADLPGRADVTVVSFNTLLGEADPAAIAGLVAGAGGQMVALPETTRRRAQQVVDRLAADSLHFQLFTGSDGPGAGQTTSLLLRSDLGAYRQVEAPFMLLGAVRAVPVSGRGPTLVAVHPGSPTPDIGYDHWAQYVATAVAQCTGTSDAVVAGDFNATVDHAPMTDLGRCRDAATEAGRGAEGTWPSTAPAPFAAPIDHVLVDGSRFRVLGTRTVHIPGSDHRALIARLQVTGG
ncbi:endonuclease/exonuclease/phosphatase family protein [Nakamurella endophytica]|uniref:Endonuclease n=1 Tax=Nakamurella endophytica TaxID=1748367 RepID=A0A917W9D7_9ACTN|nr:endonuclease/exonuclease/phosphatase family protein [Nakamurella endophytica]GGL85650.1 endonuclease [Nakamurella endophytica]